jgi:hypothetical protein
MRSYSVAIASLAIDAPQKWTDNLLSHHSISAVVAECRGVARKIPHHALLQLALIRQLNTELHLGVRDAVRMADRLRKEGEGEDRLDLGVLHLSVDRIALAHRVERRLRDALESAPALPRGRPVRRRIASTGD